MHEGLELHRHHDEHQEHGQREGEQQALQGALELVVLAAHLGHGALGQLRAAQESFDLPDHAAELAGIGVRGDAGDARAAGAVDRGGAAPDRDVRHGGDR